MIDPSESSLPVVPARPAWKGHLRRFGPYVAGGVGILVLGMMLGAALFQKDPKAGATTPCKEAATAPAGGEGGEAVEAGATATGADGEAARPAAKRKPTSRSRLDEGSGSGSGSGGHF